MLLSTPVEVDFLLLFSSYEKSRKHLANTIALILLLFFFLWESFSPCDGPFLSFLCPPPSANFCGRPCIVVSYRQVTISCSVVVVRNLKGDAQNYH